MSNSLFIQRMSDYQHSPLCLQSAQVIIMCKVRLSQVLLTHFHTTITEKLLKTQTYDSIQSLLLYEARVARQYWRKYQLLLPDWVNFLTRTPHSNDITNQLLDIGYHHLAQKVLNLIIQKDCTSALGLMHRAQTSDSHPLVYDLMELFRADIVDMAVLTWLRQKKKPITKLSGKQIGSFVYDINQRLNKHHYLADFKQCHPYTYYMDLQVTKFIKGVNHNEIFKPLHLPSRHDERCTCTPQ